MNNNEDSLVRRKSILIVEDNDINMYLIKKMLNIAFKNIILFEATNGQEAINLTKENSYDLILMDLQMPIMNGFEASKIIRTIDLDVPIIAVSANYLDERKTEYLDSGMNEYLEKPLTIAKISEILSKYIL